MKFTLHVLTCSFVLFSLYLVADLNASPRPSYSSKHKRQYERTGYSTSGVSNTRRPRVPLASSYWKLSNHKGTPKVIIDRGGQVASFYLGSKKIGQSPVSTGRRGYETPAGTFRITQKSRYHSSNLYGSFVSSSGKYLGEANNGQRPPSGGRYVAAPMPYFMRLTDSGVGMHAGYVPGVPASHGCIRLPKEMAEKFFENLPMGSVVVIK
ncbi:MAG: L,D-transpeptidase family protein [Verrucomicrobiota bacterium]